MGECKEENNTTKLNKEILFYFLGMNRRENCAKHCFTVTTVCVREYRMGNTGAQWYLFWQG